MVTLSGQRAPQSEKHKISEDFAFTHKVLKTYKEDGQGGGPRALVTLPPPRGLGVQKKKKDGQWCQVQENRERTVLYWGRKVLKPIPHFFGEIKNAQIH